MTTYRTPNYRLSPLLGLTSTQMECPAAYFSALYFWLHENYLICLFNVHPWNLGYKISFAGPPKWCALDSSFKVLGLDRSKPPKSC